MDETFVALDKEWRNTCKILFRQDVGSLAEFASWLSENIEPIARNKSSLSEKEVISGPTEYAPNSKWLSFDEVDLGKKFEPLGINEIKDVDSVLQAISERAYYSGNIWFGKSSHIEKSSNLNDSHYVYNCTRNGNSKYIAYCTIGRGDDNVYGSVAVTESAFCIKCDRGLRIKRSFELWYSQNSSDCYYSSGLEGCSDCLFSFNVQSKRNCIGNLGLEKSKYLAVKNKLLEEIAQRVEKEKRLPSLLDIVKKSVPAELEKTLGIASRQEAEKTDSSKIDEAFRQTTQLLFGKGLAGSVDDYGKWLSRHIRNVEECKSAADGRKLLLATYANYQKLPKNRLLGLAEAQKLGDRSSLDEKEAIGIRLENAYEVIGKIAYFNVELLEGANTNLKDCVISVDCANCYKSSATVYSKYIGYTFWPRSCSYLFGCDSPFDSNHCINIYSCTQQTRCFEIDCCGYCSDLYFGHNCENVHDSMFCFNVKNVRNAIGNGVLPADKYKQVKSALLSQIVGELEKKKDLKWDIYNVVALANARKK